jgi:hypothetical protein
MNSFLNFLKLFILNSIIVAIFWWIARVILFVALMSFALTDPLVSHSFGRILDWITTFSLFYLPLIIACLVDWFVFKALFKRYIGQIENKKIIWSYITYLCMIVLIVAYFFLLVVPKYF